MNTKLTIEKKELFAKIKQSKYFALIPDIREERIQRYTSVLLSLLAVLLSVLFAINNTLPTIAQLWRELEDTRVIVAKLDKKIEDLRTLEREYIRLQPEITKFDAAYPLAPKVPPFQGQVQAIARTANVSLNQLQTSEVDLVPRAILAQSVAPATQPSASVGPAPIPLPGSEPTSPEPVATPTQDTSKSYGFSLGVQGNAQNVLTFLNSLVSFNRILTIDSYTIVLDKANSQIWDVTITGKTYFQPNNQ